MGVGDYVHAGVGQMRVARADVGRRFITYKHQLGRLPIWGQLEVGGDEAAVFLLHGGFLGALGPGRHMLSPSEIPFLERAKTMDGRELDCELYFVRTGQTRIPLDGPVAELIDVAGERPMFSIVGAATVWVPDAVRLVLEGIGVGEGGASFDSMVVRRLMESLRTRLPQVLESGQADPRDLTTVGPALLAVGQQDGLGMRPLGVEPYRIEVARLASPLGRPPAGAEGPERRAEVEAAEDLPQHVCCRFGAPRIRFWDTRFEMPVHVSAVGYFQGDRVPFEQEQWLKELILQTLRQAAGTWAGTVLDLPGKREDWARYVTKVVAPQLAHYTGLRGRVVLEGIEIAPEELSELKRRRAQSI